MPVLLLKKLHNRLLLFESLNFQGQTMHVTIPTLTTSWSSEAIFTFASRVTILMVGDTNSFSAANGTACLTRTLYLERCQLNASAKRFEL